MHIVQDSQTAQLDLESIGIKGAALRHLRSLRLYVPKFAVLTSAFFEQLAKDSGFAQKASFAAENIADPVELAREFSRQLAELEVPASVSGLLDSTLRDLSGQGSLRIVARPSRPYMSKIDSAHHLNLTSKDAVLEAILSIMREHFSEQAVVERVEKGLASVHFSLPIVLQRFIVPDVTGIIIPYPRSGFYYITAWKGFGFDLDFHRADHYLVNYRDLMLERFLNNTSGDGVFFEESSGSITRTKILHEEAKEPFLDHDQIIDLCKLYAEHSSDLGGLALEFKIKGSDLFFVSLKDAGLLGKAERALEELRDPPVPQEVPDDAPESAPVEPDAPSDPEPSHVFIPESEPEPVVDPEPVREYEPVIESQEPIHEPESSAGEPDDDRDSIPEVTHGSDEKLAEVSRLIARYIEINPALERQFRLLEQDLLEALR